MNKIIWILILFIYLLIYLFDKFILKVAIELWLPVFNNK
jgi:hypothetical protein